MEERQNIFDKFWNIGNLQGQWEFISRNVRDGNKNRERLRREDAVSSRQITQIFTILMTLKSAR